MRSLDLGGVVLIILNHLSRKDCSFSNARSFRVLFGQVEKFLAQLFNVLRSVSVRIRGLSHFRQVTDVNILKESQKMSKFYRDSVLKVHPRCEVRMDTISGYVTRIYCKMDNHNL